MLSTAKTLPTPVSLLFILIYPLFFVSLFIFFCGFGLFSELNLFVFIIFTFSHSATYLCHYHHRDDIKSNTPQGPTSPPLFFFSHLLFVVVVGIIITITILCSLLSSPISILFLFSPSRNSDVGERRLSLLFKRAYLI